MTRLNDYDKQRLGEFYGKSLQEHGTQSPRALHWLSTKNQLTRFKLLCDVGNLSGADVLDVGCGLGDFYPFITQRFTNVKYVGIDIIPEMVKQARIKYPQGKFWGVDVYDIEPGKFDYIFASGTLSFNIAEGQEFYYQMIAHMFGLARTAVAFNMLDIAYEATDKDYLSYEKQEVAKFCSRLTSSYTITTGYELGDFTVFLPKML